MNPYSRDFFSQLGLNRDATQRIHLLLAFEDSWRSALLTGSHAPNLLDSFDLPIHEPHLLLAEAYRKEFTSASSQQRPEVANRFVNEGFLPIVTCIASEAGLRRRWQTQSVRALGTAVAIQHHLTHFSAETAAGLRLFEPGKHAIDGKKAIWKQVISIQQCLADCTDLAPELRYLKRRQFKIWWFRMLEWTHAIEKVDFDLQKSPIMLSTFQNAQALVQAHFGKTTFR